MKIHFLTIKRLKQLFNEPAGVFASDGRGIHRRGRSGRANKSRVDISTLIIVFFFTKRIKKASQLKSHYKATVKV